MQRASGFPKMLRQSGAIAVHQPNRRVVPPPILRLWKLGDRHSLGCCCVEKGVVASDHDDVRIVDSIGSSEVDSVIPAQSTILCQFASAASEGVIDLDKVNLFKQGVELGDSIA
jgi:hypothetical protein